MINAVLASFPRFHVVFVIKGYCMLKLGCLERKKRELEVQKGESGLLPIVGFLSRQIFLGSCRNSGCSVATGVGPGRAFWVVTRNSRRQRILAMCRDTILYVATWSIGYRWLLGRDRV